MQWGLVGSHFRSLAQALEWAPRMINARSESLMEKRAFRRLLPSRRCVVPSEGYESVSLPDMCLLFFLVVDMYRHFFFLFTSVRFCFFFSHSIFSTGILSGIVRLLVVQMRSHTLCSSIDLQYLHHLLVVNLPIHYLL